MRHYKYYTPIELAKLIIQLLPDAQIESVIDICCGSWNLLRAAKELYPKAQYTGVDIDVEAQNHIVNDAVFYNQDGRIFALEQLKNNYTYDLVLSNPPFGSLDNQDRIIYNSVVGQKYKGILTKRFETEMIIANMLLVNNNSLFVLVVPNTFVEGISNIKMRKELANSFEILSVIRLPNNTFNKQGIKTYTLVLQKKKILNNKTLYFEAELDQKWNLNRKGEIPAEDIIVGNWSICRYNNTLSETKSIHTFRGNISSNKFTKSGEAILHCSSIVDGSGWVPTTKFCDSACLCENELRYAYYGDIIFNRIGKHAGYWYINKHERILVSDCIIVARSELSNFNDVICRNSIKGKLNVPIRGVATPYITECDILNILNLTS